MKSVRISFKAARALQELGCVPQLSPASIRALDELRAAMAPKKSAKASRVVREKKRQGKKEETAAVYKAVAARADERCECCGYGFNALNTPEMDHFWGRGKERQTVENCWLLCRQCHRMKTMNAPMREAWLLNWQAHSKRCGHWKEAARAQDLIEAREKLGEAASALTRGAQ